MPVWIVRDPILGDGGKAKITDTLAADERVIAIVRWHGGDNAGHTIVRNGEKIAVHAIPSGAVWAQERPLMNVLGRGMVISLKRVFGEIESLRQKGINLSPQNLLISEGTHLTLRYHMAIEEAREAGAGKKATTKRGISPTYATRALYQGIRAGDVRDLSRVKQQIQEPLKWSNAIITQVYEQPPVTEDEVMEELELYRDQLLPYLGNEIHFLNGVLDNDQVVICEGAQSGLLDPDLGIYPNTTASNTWPGSIQSGCGIDPRRIERDILVVKAYTSRVGIGHLVAEMTQTVAEKVRQAGGEFGTTTGRPRRIGWFDEVIARYCKTISYVPGIELAITKVDILTGINPLWVCTDYNGPNGVVPIFPTLAGELEQCQAAFESIQGWHEDISSMTKFDELPRATQFYLERIRRVFDCPLTMVGTGPDRTQMIHLNGQ